MRYACLLLLFASCAMPQYVSKGTHDGVEVAYRWNHPMGKPSELWLCLKNTSATDKHIDVVLDLSYQGRTLESFEADTCIRAGQTLSGTLNGIYFVPQRVSTEQIKDGSAEVDVTRTSATEQPCP